MIQTEHGIFTKNDKLNLTAEQVYAEWLATKDLPPQPSETEILTNYLLDVDMRLVMVEMGLL